MPFEHVAILSSCGPDSLPFIATVHEHQPWRLLLRVVPGEVRRPTRPRAWTLSRLVQAVERRTFYKFYYPHLDQQIGRQFTPVNLDQLKIEVVDVPHHLVNTPETAERLKERGIELLVVHAAPILKPVLFEAPKWGAINVHYGIAPWFRGENTLFWALYQRAHGQLGVTIHRVNAGIDAGPPVCQGFPALEPLDDEVSLFAKSLRLAADLVPELLRTWDPSQPLPVSVGGGRNFNLRDRRVWHDLEWEFRRRLGERLPPLAERRVFFGAHTSLSATLGGHVTPAGTPVLAS